MKLTLENNNIFIIEIVLNTICNYRCSYCTPALYQGGHRLNDNDILWFIDKIIEKYPHKQINVCFTGGERWGTI